MSQMNSAMLLGADMPNTDAASDLPKKERQLASRLAKWIRSQYEAAIPMRRMHMTTWIHVRAIMRGIHYFTTRNGLFQVMPPDATKTRAVYPIMEPRYKIELGRLNSNLIGATVLPQGGKGMYGFYNADRGQAVLDHWIEEENMADTFDEANQHLLYYGMQAYYRYIDYARRRVCVRSIPGPELFPIPYTAKTPEDADGFMRAQLVSRAWLEEQDAQTEAQVGTKNFRQMTSKSRSIAMGLTTEFPGLSSHDQWSGNMEGAVVLTVWMKPNPVNPYGQWMFLVEDELFRYRNGDTSDPNHRALFNGKVPLEFVYYTKKPDDFYGGGFCGQLIAPQKEANRQLSYVVRSARWNKPINLFDPQTVDPKDMTNEENINIPLRSGGLAGDKPPFWQFTPPPVSRDVGAMLDIVEVAANRAVNHDSSIILGQQEGRTEGGPATRVLDANSRAPLQPVIDRIMRAHGRTYPEVLDMLKEVWPPEKTIRVTGRENIGREMLLTQNEVPASSEVIIKPTPMQANGRNAMVEFLMYLRQLPSDDMKTPEISSREMRRSLTVMGMSIPGIDMVDPEERRIAWRINLLVNDGQQPAVPPADMMTNPELQMENHPKAIEMLRERILEPGYTYYSPQVKQALLMELKFHRELLEGIHPQKFDDDIDDDDARRQERFLDAAENDLGSMEGQMVVGGVPLGMM